MNSKAKVISIVLCIVVIVGCYVGYSAAVSDMYFDIIEPDFYSMIDTYDTEKIGIIPASEAAEYGAYSWDDDLQAVEITYELYNPFNETIMITGDLCYYMGKDAEWIVVYRPNGSESDLSGYDNCKILPPGENAVIRECVLVPEGMDEIYAYGNFGITEKVLIRL